MYTLGIARYPQSAPHRMHLLTSDSDNMIVVVLKIALVTYDARTHYNMEC